MFGIAPALVDRRTSIGPVGATTVDAAAPILAGWAPVALALGAESVVLLSVGRLLSGIALGSGDGRRRQLGRRTHDPVRHAGGVGHAARRYCPTAGFGVGAAVAGVMAQWGPWPTVAPYVVTVIWPAVSAVALWPVPETRFADRKQHGSLFLADLRILSAFTRRFPVVAGGAVGVRRLRHRRAILPERLSGTDVGADRVCGRVLPHPD